MKMKCKYNCLFIMWEWIEITSDDASFLLYSTVLSTMKEGQYFIFCPREVNILSNLVNCF